MSQFFTTILYQPLFNIFVGLYNYIPDVGVVILVFTALIKLVLYPLTASSIKSQKSLTELQPKLEEAKLKYKGNQQAIAQETMRIYKENKVSPFASCLPLLIQLPILIALYYVLQKGLTSNNFDLLYPFIKNPGTINTIAFGFLDLKNGNIVLALLAGAAQFWQARMMIRKQPPKEAGAGAKDEGMMATMNKQMLYFMPVMTVFIGISLPGGLTLYWFFSTVLTALQQLIVFKKHGMNQPPTAGKQNGGGGNEIIEGEVVK